MSEKKIYCGDIGCVFLGERTSQPWRECKLDAVFLSAKGVCYVKKSVQECIAESTKPKRDPSIDPCMCGTQRCYPDSCDAYKEHQEWLSSENMRKLEQGRK